MSNFLQPHGLSMPGFPVHNQLPELAQLMSIDSVMWSNHLILCHPLLLLPSIFSSMRVFSNLGSFCIRWPKDWSFSFNISPSSEYSGLISFRMDWLDLLAVQETLKTLLWHHNLKASILKCSVSLWHSSHTCTWLLYKPKLLLAKYFYWQNYVSAF